MLSEKRSSWEEEQSPDIYRSRLFLLSRTGEFLFQFIDDIVKFMIAEIIFVRHFDRTNVWKTIREKLADKCECCERNEVCGMKNKAQMFIEVDSSFSSHRRVSTSCDITFKFGNRSARFQVVQELAARAVRHGIGC